MTAQKSKMASQVGLKEVVSLYQTLIKEWNRKPVDLEKVGKLLSGMKVSTDNCLLSTFYPAVCNLRYPHVEKLIFRLCTTFPVICLTFLGFPSNYIFCGWPQKV